MHTDRWRARAYDTLGSILLESGKPHEGLGAYQREQQLTDYKALLATAHYWTGDTLARIGRLPEALDAHVRSLAISEQLAAADPQGYSVVFSRLRVGNVLASLHQHERALNYYRRAEVASAAAVGADPTNLWSRAGLVEIHAFTCASLVSLGRHADNGTCTETLRMIDDIEVEPTNAVIRASLARSLTVMAGAFAAAAEARGTSRHDRVQRWVVARSMYRSSVAIWADMSQRGMLTSSDDEEAARVSKSLEAADAALRRLGAA